MDLVQKLAEISDQLTARKDDIAEAEKNLDEKKEALHRELESSIAAVTKLIKDGDSTGDPLKDLGLVFYRFDEERIEKLLTFNKKLKEAKGQHLVVLVPREEEYGPVHSSQKRTEFTVFLAELSGEGLIIEETGDELPNLIFPASSRGYVAWHLPDQREKIIREEGPLTAFGSVGFVLYRSSQIGTRILLHVIAGDYKEFVSSLRLRYYIGPLEDSDEATVTLLHEFGQYHELVQFREAFRCLQKATRAEAVRAEDI